MDRTARVLIVQDRPKSILYQREQLLKEASRQGVTIVVESFDLRRPSSELIDALRGGEGYDWLVTDLIRDNVDLRPETSKGVELLQAIKQHDLFGHYGSPSSSDRGIRCIAVCSVAVEHGSVPDVHLAERLTAAGVQDDYLCKGGDLSPLAEKICGRLKAEGFRGL